MFVSKNFSFDSDDLLISRNQHCFHCVFSVSNFKQQSVVAVEELESTHMSFTPAVHLNFSGLLACLWHHEVLHWKITILLSALPIARDEVEIDALTTIVFKSCKKEVFGSLFGEVSPHSLVRDFNFLVLVVGRAYFDGKRDVLKV
jgi:hypothetical protein